MNEICGWYGTVDFKEIALAANLSQQHNRYIYFRAANCSCLSFQCGSVSYQRNGGPVSTLRAYKLVLKLDEKLFLFSSFLRNSCCLVCVCGISVKAAF